MRRTFKKRGTLAKQFYAWEYSVKKKNGFLLEKASDSRSLAKRAEVNETYAENDFGLWVKNILDNISFSSVLDVCCGTGNQLVIYASKSIGQIFGVDVSRNALNQAARRLRKIKTKSDITLKAVSMEEMFACPEFKDKIFDLVSCFYGLYYCRDLKYTVNSIIDHVAKGGAFLIVGPYGSNNAGLFSFLGRHFDIPELVIRSSTTFMEKEVYRLLNERCEVRRDSFINRIIYPDPETFIKYWKSSTFYFSEYEKDVTRDIKNYFLKHEKFAVDKHVLAYIARRKK